MIDNTYKIEKNILVITFVLIVVAGVALWGHDFYLRMKQNRKEKETPQHKAQKQPAKIVSTYTLGRTSTFVDKAKENPNLDVWRKGDWRDRILQPEKAAIEDLGILPPFRKNNNH